MSNRLSLVLALLVATPAFCLPAAAQKATEQFIPVGQSPGLSDRETLRGRVESANAARGALTVATADGLHEVNVTDTTRIWMDRTNLGEPNVPGTLADCEPNRTIEVKLEPGSETAEWVKVQMVPPPASDP
jgi:hypothetical protein